MRKQISTKVGVLTVLLVAVMAGTSVLFIAQEKEEIVLLKEDIKHEEVTDVNDEKKEDDFMVDEEFYGKVSMLGELRCLCFILVSEEKKIEVWYYMEENIEEIKNGDYVLVTGDFSSEENKILAENIKKIE